MGYTHYWRSKPNLDPIIWDCFMRDVKRILDTTDIPLTDIEISKDKVTLNGVGVDSHEDLWITRTGALDKYTRDSGIRLDFCKTARKPYDEVVTAVLLLLAYHFGPESVTLGSDGAPGEWARGENLVLRATGLPVKASLF